MESWQKDIIVSNLPELVEYTKCTVGVLNELVSKRVLNDGDKEDILRHDTDSLKSDQLYTILRTRKGAFNILKDALKHACQTGAYNILNLGDEGSGWRTFKLIHYNKEDILGKGSTGTKVLAGKMDLHGSVAVKVIRDKPDELEKVTKELEIRKRLNAHSNIVQLFHMERKLHRCIYLAFELCTYNLEEYIRLHQVGIEKLEILNQIATGLEFLHDHNIIHRHLKPTHILIAVKPNGSHLVKLTSLSLAENVKSGFSVLTGLPEGSEHWTAPEILSGKMELSRGNPVSVKPSFKSDIYSLGRVFRFVLADTDICLQSEFCCNRNSSTESYPQVLNVADEFGGSVRDLLMLMTSPDPNDRPCIKMVQAELAVPDENSTLASSHNSSSNPARTVLSSSHSSKPEVEYQPVETIKDSGLMCDTKQQENEINPGVTREVSEEVIVNKDLKLNIKLCFPTKSYQPDEIIEGLLHIQCESPWEARGFAFVAWNEDDEYEEYNQSEQKYITKIRNLSYNAEQKFAHEFADIESETSEVHSKERWIQFKLPIPANAPSTVKSDMGSITYNITAIIEDAISGHKMIVQEPLIVKGALDLNKTRGLCGTDLARPASVEVLKGDNFFKGREGQMRLVFKLPTKTGFVPGEMLDFIADVENNSNKKILYQKFSIVQKITYHAEGRSKITYSDIYTKLGPEITAGEHQTWSPTGVEIPDLIPTGCGGHCISGIIDMSYAVSMTLKFKGWTSSKYAELPITIGTVPLK